MGCVACVSSEGANREGGRSVTRVAFLLSSDQPCEERDRHKRTGQ
jgi:hypothetical protein